MADYSDYSAEIYIQKTQNIDYNADIYMCMCNNIGYYVEVGITDEFPDGLTGTNYEEVI